MSNLLAIDIVLLPSPQIMDQIISLTSHLAAADTRLNKTDCLPHLTLAMGALEQSSIPEVSEVLQELAENSRKLEIKLLKTKYYDTPDKKHFSELVVEPSPELMRLHSDVMEEFRPFVSDVNVETNMFFNPPEVAEISTYWVEHYFDKKSPRDFRPHFTLGEGNAIYIKTLKEFMVDRIALCHLGTYCTCRKILAEFNLK